MFSRKVVLGLSFLTVSIFNLSCSNDHVFNEETPIVNLSFDTDCLSSLDRSIDLYAEGFLTEKSIKKDFKCVREAIDYIQLRSKRETEDFYSAEEVKHILNEFLFDGDKKNLSFYKSLLLIKSQIFGGEADQLSLKDLQILKTFLFEGETLALKLKSVAPNLFFNSPFSKKNDVALLAKPLANFIERWVLFQERNLNIRSVFRFLNEADVEIKAQDSWVALINLLRSSESDKDEITHADKMGFVSSLETYYVHALDLYRSIETDWEYNRTDFMDFSAKVDLFLLEVQATINKHPKKKWAENDLNHFMSLVSAYEVLSEPLSVEVQEHVVNVVFGKWFSLESKKNELSSENFQKIIIAWADINKFLDEAKSVEGYKGKTFPFVREGEDAFSLFTQRRWPSLVRRNRTILIPDYAPEVEFTFQSLFHVSWQFLAARILVESYSDEPAQFKDSIRGMTIEQVKEAYLDVFVFLKEVGFLGEESRGGWFRIFNEGNLFVPTAVSNEVVSYSEAADYAAYMFSAYFAGKNITDYMKPKCPNFGEVCAFNYVMKDPSSVFESLPGLWSYFNPDLESKSYKIWQKSFEYIAKLTNDDSPYNTSHWFRGSVATQYNEVIFRKYDLDFSDTLNFEEVSLAYLDFKEALKLLPMVRGTSAENNDARLKSVLTFFVKKGRAPKLRNGRPTGPLIKHVAVCGSVNTSTEPICTFESDRSKLMSLLAYLTSISADF